jgi:hypothetical protein
MNDLLLKAAACEVRDAMLASLRDENCTPSPAFDATMEPLLRNISAARRKTVWTQGVKAAIIVLAVGSLTLTTPTVRAELRRWSLVVQNNVRIHYFAGETPEEALPYYAIGAFPEEYVLSPDPEDIESLKTSRNIRYENADGQYLYFYYGYMHQGSASVIYLDEGDTLLKATVNGCPAEIVLPADPETCRSLITWISEEENMDFSIMGHFSAEKLLEMAESVYVERKR